MKKIHFDIQGMTCASCQAHVRKAVQNLDGTTNVNVNLLANDMTVDIDENKIKKLRLDFKKYVSRIFNNKVKIFEEDEMEKFLNESLKDVREYPHYIFG